VGRQLCTCRIPEVIRRGPIPGDEIVDPLGGGVAAGSGIAEQDLLACAAERQRRRETRGSPPDDDDVVGHGAAPFRWGGQEVPRRAPCPRPPRTLCPPSRRCNPIASITAMPPGTGM